MTFPDLNTPIPVRRALLAALVLLVGGCAGTNRPAATPPDLAEVGEASWYGIEERGRPTASGEPMDPGALTAAHRTLPFGTIVEVTNVKTGAAVQVRINDRGPFVRSRVIDLSHEAARRLGILREGVAQVRLTVANIPPRTPFTVQVAAFGRRQAAERFSEKLRADGYSGVEITPGDGVHRVRVGRFMKRSDAELTARALKGHGYDALVVQVRL
jgi:rare lipoprotein A